MVRDVLLPSRRRSTVLFHSTKQIRERESATFGGNNKDVLKKKK